MNQRHPSNKNLTLHTAKGFNGYPVNLGHGPLIQEYLVRAQNVVCTALTNHPRSFVIGATLRAPAGLLTMPDNAISRFIESLKAQIAADRNRAMRKNQRAHLTDIRYIWTKEKGTSNFYHYHVMIFLNADAYHTLGNLQSNDCNMAVRIVNAWATALSLFPDDVRDSVHFSRNGNRKYSVQDFNDLMFWASYLCKSKTKNYGDRSRNFGCSMN